MIKIVENFNDIFLKDIEIIDKIVNKIKASKDIAIIGHIDPDGDCIGSQLALYESLKGSGFNVDKINEGPFENKYINMNKKDYKKDIEKDYDLILILDTPAKSRIGKFYDKIDFSKVAMIDHHYTSDNFGEINWTNANFISTSEMVFLLLYRMGIGLDNKEVCQHLLNGIIADNGFFRHIRVDKYFSLIIAYYLIENGADPKKSYNLIFGKKSFNSKKILCIILDRLQDVENGKILWTYITDEDKKEFNNAIIDSVNVFNEIMSVEGVEIGIYFKNSKEGTDISFRSNDNVDVAKLASFFNGGGHKVASGAKLSGDFEEIKAKVLIKAVEILNESVIKD